FLDQACVNQPELRARLEKLLGAHDKPAGLLKRPAIELNATVDPSGGEPCDRGGLDDSSPSARPPTAEPGTVIGPDKLPEQVGEGGFGVVFMAEQTEPVRRKVALKVLKPGMDTRQVVARFEAERQALALMDHPNIAKV